MYVGSYLRTQAKDFLGVYTCSHTLHTQACNPASTPWHTKQETLMDFCLENEAPLLSYSHYENLVMLEKHGLYLIQNVRSKKLTDLLHSQLITCTI